MLAGWFGQRTAIRFNNEERAHKDHENDIVSSVEARAFWFSWTDTGVKLG